MDITMDMAGILQPGPEVNVLKKHLCGLLVLLLGVFVKFVKYLHKKDILPSDNIKGT